MNFNFKDVSKKRIAPCAICLHCKSQLKPNYCDLDLEKLSDSVNRKACLKDIKQA